MASYATTGRTACDGVRSLLSMACTRVTWAIVPMLDCDPTPWEWHHFEPLSNEIFVFGEGGYAWSPRRMIGVNHGLGWYLSVLLPMNHPSMDQIIFSSYGIILYCGIDDLYPTTVVSSTAGVITVNRIQFDGAARKV